MIKDVNKIPAFLSSLPSEKERLLRLVGAFLEGKVKLTIQQGRPEWPPLKPETIKRKGSSKPLIDTGKLMNSITHKVEKSVVKVGVFGEYAVVAAVHELGSAVRNIPARPYLKPTLDENEKNIELLIKSEIEKLLDKYKV